MDRIIQIKSVKTFVNNKELKISKDFYSEFDYMVKKLLISSINRAKSNNRNTVMKKDL